MTYVIRTRPFIDFSNVIIDILIFYFEKVFRILSTYRVLFQKCLKFLFKYRYLKTIRKLLLKYFSSLVVCILNMFGERPIINIYTIV